MKKMPPKEKALEAFTAIGDHRIQLENDKAAVTSSDGTKTYIVEWDGNVYASSDPATYWQGYPGYPVIAVLILQGKIKCNDTVFSLMKGIPWKKLNQDAKRDYAKAAETALKDLSQQDHDLVMRENESVNEALSKMDLILKRKIHRNGKTIRN